MSKLGNFRIDSWP